MQPIICNKQHEEDLLSTRCSCDIARNYRLAYACPRTNAHSHTLARPLSLHRNVCMHSLTRARTHTHTVTVTRSRRQTVRVRAGVRAQVRGLECVC